MYLIQNLQIILTGILSNELNSDTFVYIVFLLFNIWH